MNSTGVYIQVPFCASKCSFCNFSSRVERPESFAPYCRAVCREMERLPEILEGCGLPAQVLSSPTDTIYVGGGTPSIVGAELLAEMIESLTRRFSLARKVEFTLETTPGSANRESLLEMRALGVNRLSIGAQSFNDRELRAVGRLHSSGDTRLLFDSARRHGFSNLSLDLIAGLPHQDRASWEASLRAVAELRPEHVSVYLFEVDEKSRLGKEVLEHGSRYHADAVPDEEFQAEAYETARASLSRAGYNQYEISNFALPGYESLHNRKYWRMESYLGIGAGAHSFDGSRRWANVSAPEAYVRKISRGESPIAEFRPLSSRDQIEEFFFLGLRQAEGIDLGNARRRWGPQAVARWDSTISNLIREGWLEQRAENLRMQGRAYLVSNEVFQEFIQ